MSNSNLITVKRMDKNGKLVTRHVKADALSGPKQPSIAAPTLKQPEPAPQYQSEHIAYSDDPRVMNGEVLDRVVYNDTVYSRLRDGVTPDEFNTMRVQFSRKMKDGESQRVASLVGYAFTVAFRTKYGSVEVDSMDTPYSVVLDADTWRANTSDMDNALQRFQESLMSTLQEGSPIRKTDRAGANTAGTRAVPGLEDNDLDVEFYFDVVRGDRVTGLIKDRGLDFEAIDAVLDHNVQPLAEGAL